MNSLYNARDAISRLIIKNHSPKQRVEDVLSESYPAGKKGAIREMNRHMPPKCPKLDNSSFPDTCPWSFGQMMSEDWYPLNGVSLYE